MFYIINIIKNESFYLNNYFAKLLLNETIFRLANFILCDNNLEMKKKIKN